MRNDTAPVTPSTTRSTEAGEALRPATDRAPPSASVWPATRSASAMTTTVSRGLDGSVAEGEPAGASLTAARVKVRDAAVAPPWPSVTS